MRHTVTTVSQYLSALQNMCDQAGAGPLPHGPKFHFLLKGLHRMLE
jgi:hypothetical protein